MQVITIKGQERTELGKKGASAVRKAGMIPCVLYGGDKVVHFSTTLNEVRHLIYTPDFKTAMLDIEGQHYRCILKDRQFDPIADHIIHLDFLHMEDGSPLKVEVPIRFKGTSPGVKAGGKLVQKVRTVKIKAMPENLVDELTVDISKLELGQSIRIRDVKATDGVEILNTPGTPIATIEIPRALRSAQQAAEKAASGGKKK
ncbi:MAG TPA: 50S ribosomal protein L25/general stress protein Ctc [Saprospiraceae bacterium]|jgi:large subunit ribosomal protein L25|nr:50S ribosomal protein L25/general stress protein Ctc [Saprospiraceae bacterium]HMP14229.1 50S ribosomal protein L25/general stress protein Ctc [Saprospiraceae bacterium]